MFAQPTFSGTVEGYIELTGLSGINNGFVFGVSSQDGPVAALGSVGSQQWNTGGNEEWVSMSLVITHVVQGSIPEHGQVRRFSLHRGLVRQSLHREITVIEVDPDNASN